MKLNKLLLLSALSLMIFSCSEDTMESVENTDVNAQRIAIGQYDNSNLGVYKGVFTTVDSQQRGTLEINLSPSTSGSAVLILNSGETINLTSNSTNELETVNALTFSGKSREFGKISFDFSVGHDGTNPTVNSIAFDNKTSDILIGKDTQRNPLSPVTGTYACTNCSTVYPGFAGGAHTWNILSIGNGNGQTFQTQVVYNGNVYTSPASNNVQSGCSNSAGFRTCIINGTSQIATKTLVWTGTHRYPQGGGSLCSEMHGTWTLVIDASRTIMGTFDSDTTCP